MHYAHSSPDGGEGERLECHLADVARLARSFAARFEAGAWAELAGRWHDLGKFSAEFQSYLRAASSADPHTGEATGRVDHSTAGAQHAHRAAGYLGTLLAYIIAGHHAGLPDGREQLRERLHKQVPAWSAAPAPLISATDLPEPPLAPLDASQFPPTEPAFRIAFFVRMVFSCLVDADFLCTEEFMNRAQAAFRHQTQPGMAELGCALDDYLTRFDDPENAVNEQRAAVLTACRAAGEGAAPGLFSLTVPTGGGKTLASLAFALCHARQHGMERVIYVVPFTSIIEQNAAVFREAFAAFPDAVLEHHSNFDPARETTASRLREENWDAPIVVTTSVQFFESLFANRTSRCRKLHCIANSVVIFDEAQTLPVKLLAPCLAALRALVADYRASLVLCTATQPTVERTEEFRIGLGAMREIVPDAPQLFSALRRIRPTRVVHLGSLSDAALVARLRAHESCLIVVNTRRHARTIFELLGTAEEAHFHLSASMCPEHRSAVLAQIRARLKDRAPVRLISTQLIEAGVDLDFPVVYRAECGLDSLAQAAGRCNRHGLLPEGKHGEVFFFDAADTPAPPGHLRQSAQTARRLLGAHADDLLSLAAVRDYFCLHYLDRKHEWDDRKVLAQFSIGDGGDDLFGLNFAAAASLFRMIDNEGKPVLIPWNKVAEGLAARLRAMPYPTRREFRLAQRFSVQIPERALRQLLDAGSVEQPHDGFVFLTQKNLYHDKFGLSLDGVGQYDPESLIAG